MIGGMADEPWPRTAQGYLHVHGDGGLTAHQMRDVLAGLDDSYVAIAKCELFVRQEFVAARGTQRWLRRWGPPEFLVPLTEVGAFRTGGIEAMSGPSSPLVVSRVVLTSPGFWEFLGSLNPLEVIRQYLTDRHEREKDRDYRSRAEAERLAIENAARKLDVFRQYLDLQREYGDELGSTGLQEQVIGAMRPALEGLGEVDDRRLIAGETARTSREPIDPHAPAHDADT
jgi:hypothetical protein